MQQRNWHSFLSIWDKTTNFLATTFKPPRLHYRTAEYSGHPDEGGVLSGALFLQSKIRGRNKFIAIMKQFRPGERDASYVNYDVLPIELFADPRSRHLFADHVSPVG
jgi:hypothetical protein